MGARRLALACSIVVLVSLVCLSLSTVAFAAPEAPVTEAAGSVGANSAQLNGELNPSGLANNGWYFAYNTGGACLGGGRAGGEGPVEVEKEKVSAEAGGLEPGTLYTYCLVAYNEVGEETSGSTQSFTTSVSQPVIDSESTSGVGSSTATLEAQVNPEKQETSCLRFEYGETEAYGSRTPCTSSSLGEGFGDQPAAASLTKLKVDTTYHFRVVVENKTSPAGGTFGMDQTFATLPMVEGESFSNVGSDSAVLSADINVYGVPVTYHFEYSTTNAYGSSTEVMSTGAMASRSTVTATPEGLTPGSEYHFRIVATNTNGETIAGADIIFDTLPAGIQGLPDQRVYEMVTPIEKEDEEVYIPGALGFEGEETEQYEGQGYRTFRSTEAAANGDAFVYQGSPTHDAEGESAGNGLGSSYLAKRSADGGWTQESIQPAGRRATLYRGFSSDLSIGVLKSPDESAEEEAGLLPGGKPPAGKYYELYRHPLNEEDYRPLFTVLPNRSPKELSSFIADSGPGNLDYEVGPAYAGGTGDMSQLLFEENDALLEGEGFLEKELTEDASSEIAKGQKEADYLYDWDRGYSTLVDVGPDGKVVRNATFGAPHLPGANPPGNSPDFSHVISTDGSRVFWTAVKGEGQAQVPIGLYVRENTTMPQSPVNGQGECLDASDACTIQLDGAIGGGARFWTASSDGSKVFFTKGALYEYELNPTVGRPGLLTDLTPGIEVQGVVGASDDGDYIYYADSTGKLSMLHDSGSKWEDPVSIATLSAEDGESIGPFWSLAAVDDQNKAEVGDLVPDLGQRTAEVTPDGHGLVFMSNQSLEVDGFPHGYRNGGQEEVYVYDALAERLFCASCDPSGEPPSFHLEEEAEGTGVAEESEAASFVPVSWSNTYIPSWMSEDGDRVFFDSVVPLVSSDTNGRLDVYEWEKEGSGSCGQGDGADGGCIYLLSGGTSSDPSWLLGSSTNGSDVFMATRSDLTSEAQDEFYKVFDARVDGVKPVVAPVCTGTGCQGLPESPPTFATPSSVTFSGVGNFQAPASSVVKVKARALTRARELARALKACSAKPKARRASCRVQARRRYGPQKKKSGSALKRGRK